jgi:hypothetical protein
MIVEYCPTEDMISDVLTKPLQGSAFCKLRALLLNMENDPTTRGVVLVCWNPMQRGVVVRVRRGTMTLRYELPAAGGAVVTR